MYCADSAEYTKFLNVILVGQFLNVKLTSVISFKRKKKEKKSPDMKFFTTFIQSVNRNDNA